MSLAFVVHTLRFAVTLFSLIVFGAVSDCIGGEIDNTNIRPILVADDIRVDGSERNSDGKIPSAERSKLLIRNNPIRAEGATNSLLEVSRRDTGANDSLRSTNKGIFGFGIEPMVGLAERVVTQENTAVSTNPCCGSFSGISTEKINEDSFIRLKLDRNRVNRDVWPLVLIEQSPSRAPLENGNDNSAQRDESSNSRQKNHPSVKTGSVFQIGYSLFELVMALGILMYAHSQLIRQWNRRAFFVLAILYLAAGGLIFHALSVLLFL